jgi:transposase
MINYCFQVFKSPDLNPIEHLWDEFGRRVRRRVNPPESIDQLQRALTDERNNIPQAPLPQ